MGLTTAATVDPQSATTASDAGKAGKATSRQVILLPTASQTYTGFEYSVHIPPRALLREITSVFPGVDISSDPRVHTPLLVIPTFQRAALPLLEYGDRQAEEKDRLLERFFQWCQQVHDAIKAFEPDAWVDATDPASGTAWKGNAGSCYSDVDGIIRLLRYETVDVGCRIAAHPVWRFAVYPATLFTTAPQDVVKKALNQVNLHLELADNPAFR